MSERLEDIAFAMVADGRGLLAADESTGTIKKRFDGIGLESTETSRRDYREMLVTAEEAMTKYISGVILYEETLFQTASTGRPLADVIRATGAIPGIKVDMGAKPMAHFPGETVTEGLDAEVAERTVRVLKRTVPSAVPGIAFLSGGQSTEEATAHLSAMNAGFDMPWALTFSYGRALQTEALNAWGGKPENVAAGPRAFSHRAKMCSLAATGAWKKDLEQAA